MYELSSITMLTISNTNKNSVSILFFPLVRCSFIIAPSKRLPCLYAMVIIIINSAVSDNLFTLYDTLSLLNNLCCKLGGFLKRREVEI